jgi:hypothetical protein
MRQNNEISYGRFIKESSSVKYTTISYNQLTQGNHKAQGKIKLRGLDIYRLLQPYISVRFMDQFKALMPLVVYLVLFQFFILKQPIADALLITGGLSAVIIGLMFFMEGIEQGLMPLGNMIGNTLPKRLSLGWVLFIAFLLGIGVTFAEPAIGALKAAGATVPYLDPATGEAAKSIYLYALLNMYTTPLVLLVGVGVGLAAVLGTVRFVKGWSLKPYIYLALLPVILLTIYFMSNDYLSNILGLAWDSGAVTTGPVTVPLVLALGIGIASAAGSGNNSLSGFGIVTLASLFPIMVVELLALYVYMSVPVEEILLQASQLSTTTQTTLSWYETSPGEEIILGVRAIIPLVIFLFFIMLVVLKEKIKDFGRVAYGIVLAVIGMCIFNIGLTYGLSMLGGQSGSLIPAAFTQIVADDGTVISQIYPYVVGIGIAIAFAWILGFGATLAEPALNALGQTVENLTNGVFKKKMLIYAVSIGVGTGIALGIVKIIFQIPLGYLLIPAYGLAVVLTVLSSEEFVNIAWDSAGVTTGPITVPLVLAMGLGIAGAIGGTDGFGILSLASIGPIISVLSTGLYVKYKHKSLKGEL